MKRITLFFLSVFAWTLCFAQSDESQANSLFAKGQYEDAAQLYDTIAARASDVTERDRLFELAKKCRTCQSLLQIADREYYAENWEAAESTYKQLLQKNPNDSHAIHQLISVQEAMARIQAEDARETERVAAAEARIEAIQAENEDLRAAEREAAASLVRRVEEAWNRLDKCSVAELDAFIEEFKVSYRVEEAKRLRASLLDEQAWSVVKTKEDYEYYISWYPKGAHVEEARNALKNWDETQMWNDVRKENTEAAYKSYLDQYPSGLFVLEAQRGINVLKDEAAWQQALDTDTSVAYLNYINLNPSGSHLMEASQRKKAADVAEKMQKEEAEKMLRNPSLSAIKEFEARYPNSPYMPSVYDYYASWLCDRLDLDNCKQSSFDELRSYTTRQETLNKIQAKEKQWQEKKAQERSSTVMKAVTFSVAGALFVTSVALEVAKGQQESR